MTGINFPQITPHHLRRTSRLWGLQTCYLDQAGHPIHAPATTLIKVLEALTSTRIQSDDDLKALAKRRILEHQQRGIEASKTAWVGEPATMNLYLNLNEAKNAIQISLRSDTGEHKTFAYTPSARRDRLSLTEALATLSPGYFDLELKTVERNLRSFVILAPARISDIDGYRNSWGIFLPLYASRGEHDWGVGSYTDLKKVGQQIRPFGGKWISSLPVLATNFDREDCDPSPYCALTRLFWNEIYLDVDRLAHESGSSAAEEALRSGPLQAQLRQLRAEDFVDYYKIYQLKREVLAILAKEFFAAGGSQNPDYLAFREKFPDLDAYTQFRSPDPVHQDFHRYVQFQCHRSLSEIAQEGAAGLYMDYPVGVNESGYDYFTYRDLFLSGFTVGAPPEPVFQKGQEWGFPSYRPDVLRESKYEYVRKSLTNHFRYSRILRLDHVMGLHRVFIVPRGSAPKDGVYLRYKPEDLFAIACLEAERASADLIGENLGTVPEAVNALLEKRNFKGMTVGQFLFEEDPEKLASHFPERTLACLNTHDMPLFKAFLNAEDLDQVTELGILDPQWKDRFKEARALGLSRWLRSLPSDATADAIFPALLEKMAKSQARYLILNPEDTWGEKRPQNIPGTFREVPNWRRKFKLPTEDWIKDSGWRQALGILQESRP